MVIRDEMSTKEIERQQVKSVEIRDPFEGLLPMIAKLHTVNQGEMISKDSMDSAITMLKSAIEAMEELKISENSIPMDSLLKIFQPEKCMPAFSALAENSSKNLNGKILFEEIETNKIEPVNSINHIAIIPDGNRRWAKEMGLQPWEGHNISQKILNRIVHTLWTRGVHTITVWLMSPENFNRSAEELHHLWIVFEICFSDIRVLAKEFNARCCHVGNKHRLPPRINQLINSIEEDTKGNTKKRLNFAIDYSGREDILRAMSLAGSESTYVNTQVSASEENIKKNLWGGDQLYPEPDLIVRTGSKDSKTVRMSGFMIWQSVYSELLFVDKYMPEVTVEDVDTWIESFKRADRRFGK